MAELEEFDLGVRWQSACESVSPDVEDRPLLEDVNKQSSEEH
jgi:hypothetical protein